MQASIFEIIIFIIFCPSVAQYIFESEQLFASSKDAVDHYYVNHLPIIFEISHNENFSPSKGCNAMGFQVQG